MNRPGRSQRLSRAVALVEQLVSPRGYPPIIRPRQPRGYQCTPDRSAEMKSPAGGRARRIDLQLKAYTVYGPLNRKDGIERTTKTEAFEEHFDGKTTE